MQAQLADGTKKTVLILGATGMLGHALMHELSEERGLVVRGVIRSLEGVPPAFTSKFSGSLEVGPDLLEDEARVGLLSTINPDVVINAVGIVKQDPSVKDAVRTVRINALLPHLLSRDCADLGVRLIHVSTDCVFSGQQGGYGEEDIPDPPDLYGRSKLLGEVDAPALTLRTSIIGHEIRRHESLLDWFLSQPTSEVLGYTNAIYSGITTIEFARLLSEVVFEAPEMAGLWHVASTPISKCELLRLVDREYRWGGKIVPDSKVQCDRSMTADRLARAYDYRPPPWPQMIRQMREARDRWRTPEMDL